MSPALIDLRSSVPEFTDAWLEIEHKRTGKDKSAIVRDILNRWAWEKAHAHKVAAEYLRRHGMEPAVNGISPNDDGDTRSGVHESRTRGCT